MTANTPGSRKLILLLIIITSFINPFLGAAINIALPAISEEFSMGAVGMSWVAMAFLLSSAVRDALMQGREGVALLRIPFFQELLGWARYE